METAAAIASLGEGIRAARMRRKVSQIELARIVGKSRPIVSAWENNRDVPDINELRTMARQLEAPWLWALAADEGGELTSSCEQYNAGKSDRLVGLSAQGKRQKSHANRPLLNTAA